METTKKPRAKKLKEIPAGQTVDVKDKFLVINSNDIDVASLKAIQEQLRKVGCLGVMVFPVGAKVDVATKAELQRQIEAL